MPLITIFTPVYNRAHLIERVYRSLTEQLVKDFEWVVVDDGSVDNIHTLMQRFVAEASFPVRFYRQDNKGKHIAINNGLSQAKGELFLILDSDDVLLPYTVSIIKKRWLELLADENVNLQEMAGMCGVKVLTDQTPLTETDYDVLDADYNTYHFKGKYEGDKAEIFITEILKMYPFPRTPGEKFCPEALVWHRIGQKFKLRYLNDKIYVVEYQDEGLTANTIKIRAGSPVNSTMLYRELAADKRIPLYYRVRATINYWRFYFYNTYAVKNQPCSVRLPLWAVFCYPLGFVLFKKDKKTLA